MSEELVPRMVYAIQSRNLLVGVYTGKTDQRDGQEWQRFIGIREKFGYRYLTEEYGWNPRPLGMIPDRAEMSENDRVLRRSLAAYQAHYLRDHPWNGGA